MWGIFARNTFHNINTTPKSVLLSGTLLLPFILYHLHRDRDRDRDRELLVNSENQTQMATQFVLSRKVLTLSLISLCCL